MVRLRLDVAYDGTEFSGWAAQPGRRTVQGLLQEAVGRVLRLDSPPALTVAGRTDAGVHARGQVAHADVALGAWQAAGANPAARQPEHQPEQRVVRRLAGLLPPDVRVLAIAPCPDAFDARFSALSRRYSYRVADTPWGVDPLRRRDVLWHARRLDLAAMDAAASTLLGEHDFAAFCRRRDGATTVRTLHRLRWSRELAGLAIADVAADAFCHSMVRALVGALLAVGDGRRPVEWPGRVLAAGVRDSAVTVAPALGLTLEEVRYPAEADLAARAAESRRLRAPA